MATPTPKSHLPSTPSRLMASPRPGTAAGKTLAYKSPANATKTPASTHGHFHGLSVSSQPSSTPLAATVHDELLNLNSPAAALINSLAQNGLTPLGSGQDGLGLSTQGQIGAGRNGHVTRTPAEERLHRLQQATESLKSRVVGRGISREGIERVARLHGFEALWDEDNLVIAGNVVEIEITFDSALKGNVRDLSLKFNYDDEQHVQQDGTSILKAQAGVQTQAGDDRMTDLAEFADNIRYLAELDPIDVKPNTFQLVGNLYQSFQDIWKEEKKRMQWRNGLQHLRQGSLGVPNMDRTPELGLTIGYWRKGCITSTDDLEATGKPPDLGPKEGLWRAKISCEAGMPSLISSKDWLTPKILTDSQPGQNVLDPSDTSYKPDWRDFTVGLGMKTGEKDGSGMDVDKAQPDLPQPLSVHFTFDLQPEVLLPLGVVGRLNAEINMIDIDPQRASTYHRSLQEARNIRLGRQEESNTEARWGRRLPCVDSEGRVTYGEHSYKLYSATQDTELWCYPVSRIRFNHPRQIAELLPTLRQHIVVWSLLETLVSHPSTAPSEQPRSAKSRGVFKRSNRPSNGATKAAGGDTATLNIDLLLDVMSNPSKARLEVFAPLKRSNGHRTKESMLHLSIQVSPGGSIHVIGLDGVNDADLPGLKTKLGKMLTATEDVGIVLQWLLDRAKE